ADRPLALGQTLLDGSRTTWGAPTLLHAHRRDAAQQGFSAACTVTRAQRRLELESHYPHRRTSLRTRTWKQTGIRVHPGGERAGGVLLLARARGREPVQVALPLPLQGFPAIAYKQPAAPADPPAPLSPWRAGGEGLAHGARACGVGILEEVSERRQE